MYYRTRNDWTSTSGAHCHWEYDDASDPDNDENVDQSSSSRINEPIPFLPQENLLYGKGRQILGVMDTNMNTSSLNHYNPHLQTQNSPKKPEKAGSHNNSDPLQNPSPSQVPDDVITIEDDSDDDMDTSDTELCDTDPEVNFKSQSIYDS